MSAKRPASLTLCPASQYLTARGCTPAASAQFSAVLFGHIPRAARTGIVSVQSIAWGCNPLPRILIASKETTRDVFGMKSTPLKKSAAPPRTQNLFRGRAAQLREERQMAGVFRATGKTRQARQAKRDGSSGTLFLKVFHCERTRYLGCTMVLLDATALIALFQPQNAGKGAKSDFEIPCGSFRIHSKESGVGPCVGLFEIPGELKKTSCRDGPARLPVRHRRRPNPGHLGGHIGADGFNDGFNGGKDHTACYITARELVNWSRLGTRRLARRARQSPYATLV
jgi:hypothetical protein